MPREAHGGDDDEEFEEEEEQKKPRLDKYHPEPDKNIKDIYWAIMASYATTGKFNEISSFKNDRIPMMNAALSVLLSPHKNQYGMGPSFVARYSMMMFLDGGWNRVFRRFIRESMESRRKVSPFIIKGIRHLLRKKDYVGPVSTCFKEMLRSRKEVNHALRLITLMKNKKLISQLEKELIIFAKGDVGENQMNAIEALKKIKEDPDVKNAFIKLLSHWDAEVRLETAKVLKKMKTDKEVKTALKKRLKEEEEKKVLSILKKAIK